MTRKRIEKNKKSKLKEELKVPKMRGSVQTRSTEEQKPLRGNLQFRLGIRDRKAAKERREKENQRNDTSPEKALQTPEEVLQIVEEQPQTSENLPAVMEVPAPPSGDEESMSRSSSLLCGFR